MVISSHGGVIEASSILFITLGVKAAKDILKGSLFFGERLKHSQSESAAPISLI